jgi:hypothetical protein
MSIPTHQQWMLETAGGFTKPRSARLKAIDQAILQYNLSKNPKDIWRIKNAFEDWKREKGAQWDKSLRNRSGAISRLNADLMKAADYRTYQITHFSIQELMALQAVAKERKKVIASVFEGREVTFKAAKIKDQLKASADNVKETAEKGAAYIKSIKKGGPPTAGPSASDIVKKKMIEMVKTYFGVEGLEQLGTLSGLILSILEKAAVSVPPVVGHIKDGYDLFTEWAKTGAALYKQYDISDRGYSIDVGVPTQAFSALMSCLKDETKNQAISATRSTTSFALKTGLVFVDGGAISGPVVGAANALADFAHKMFLLGTEWRATRGINRALTDGDLDIRLFRTYPLMGCYLLISATLSDLIPIESFGTPGWMDYIENLKKHAFDDIYDSATDLVEQSPWEIIGLPKRPKGTTGGFFAEVQRVFSTVSPLSDLKDLKDLAKT